MKYINLTRDKKATQKIKKIEKIMFKDIEKSYKINFMDGYSKAWIIKKNGLIFCFLERDKKFRHLKESGMIRAWVMDKEKRHLAVVDVYEEFLRKGEDIEIDQIIGGTRGMVILKNGDYFFLDCGYYVHVKALGYERHYLQHDFNHSDFCFRLNFNLEDIEERFKNR